MAILQLRIVLSEIEPKIWRRFLVNDNINFNQLHEIIQEVMGWENYHLYEFNVNGIQIGLIDDDVLDANPDLGDSKKFKLKDYLKKEKQKINYVYDFGDSWEHIIVVEKILESLPEGIKKAPICIGGERACPPEDCGSIWGYERYVEILKTGKDPDGEDVEEALEWLGDWKPEEFDLNEINKRFR